MEATKTVNGLISTKGQAADAVPVDSNAAGPSDAGKSVAMQRGNAQLAAGGLDPILFSKGIAQPMGAPSSDRGLVTSPSRFILPGSGLVGLDGSPLVSEQASKRAEATPVHRGMAQGLVQFAGMHHFMHPKVDESLGSKILDQFVDKVDPGKTLFTQGDLEGLEQLRPHMGVMFANAHIDPMFSLYDLGQDALVDYFEFVLGIADTVIDSIDMEAKPAADQTEKSERPSDVSEQITAWYHGVENLARYFLSTGESKPAVKARLRDTYGNEADRIRAKSGAERSEDAFDAVMDAFFAAVDPHSTYMSHAEYPDYMAMFSAEMVGVGVIMKSEYRADENGDYRAFVVLDDVVEDGPSGGKLRGGDSLLALTDSDGVMHDLAGLSLRGVTALCKGEDGSKLSIRVRGEDGLVREVEITRGRLNLDDSKVETGIVTLDEVKPGAPQRIGVIHLPAFFHGELKQSGNEVAKAVEKVKSQNIDALVFDLRNDGGGALPDALQIAGLFVPEGPMSQVKDSRGQVQVLPDPDPAQQYDGPLAVLINRHSASASEIVAATLQDYGRAVIMGERSHGKGSVQSVINAPLRAPGVKTEWGVKMTTAKFYRINGGTTQLNGVEPDVNFSDDPTEIYGEQELPTAMPADNIDPADYVPTGDVTAILAAQKRYSAASTTGDETKEAAQAASPNETMQQRIDRKGDDWLARSAQTLSDMYAPEAESEGDEVRAAS